MRRISRRCNEVPSASSLLFPAPTGQSVRTGNEIRITQAGHPTEQSPIADIAITRSAECRSWVKDGKTPIEHMFCGLPGIADIIENVGVSIALHLTEQSHSMGRPAFTSDAAHSTAGDVAAIALQYAPRPDQLLAELGLDLRRARWPAAAARSTCGPCSLCGVANTTASTAGSARSASRSFASAMRAQRKSPRR